MKSHSFEHLFQPITIGNLTVKNRIEMAPVGPLLAINGTVTRELIEWGKAFARGGVGIVTLGDSSITLSPDEPLANAVNLGSDLAVNPLNRYAEVVKRYGARASIQLNYHGRRMPTNMSLDEIRQISQSFAAAAYRCMRAGMDMIMVHGAHGQMISQFTSPRKNFRTDIYGGRLKNRARLVLEILEAIRNKVGNALAVEYRISAEEFIADGLQVDEQLEFAELIQHHIDLLHVSAGQLYEEETLAHMIQPTYLPRGINVEFAARFKKELQVPIVTVGSLNLEMAEDILVNKKADIVAMARTLIADPDCINKVQRGHGNAVRPCVRCNTCINRTHSQRLTIRCAVNPTIGREAELINIPDARVRKKVVVIGGGPAGMEAARQAAERGHQVVLFEKASQLGGNLLAASAAPFKTDMKHYLDWSVQTTINTPQLEVKLSTEATKEIIRSEAPDALIIAIGSLPIIPEIPGIHGSNVILAADVETGQKCQGKSVIVAGAGLSGSETALSLVRQGKKVRLIDMLSLAEIDRLVPSINVMTLRDLLRQENIDVITEVKLQAITQKTITVLDKQWHESTLSCDTVVIAFGLAPDQELINGFSELADEVYRIGDCNSQWGNLHNAVTEGFFSALAL